MTSPKDASAERRWSEWMAAVQAGDAEAYRALLDEILPVLRGMVHARMFDHGIAEDVVQNVLLSIHRARHTYRPERSFGPWMRAIARNAMIDSFREQGRRRDREVAVELIEEIAVQEPGDPLAHRDRLPPLLEKAMQRLPEKQREAVALIQLDGLSVAEAAARVGVSSGALKVRAHRGYRALRRALEGVSL
jgi:RNA polymerase sigma-70 factor (ECF subfamily)